MDQTCCGQPALMLGREKTARDVACRTQAFDDCNCDYILTLCASCASHLKKGYPRLLADDPTYAEAAERFAAKVIDFSTFARDVLKLAPSDFAGPATKTALHAPCHLCRGLQVTEAPRDMLKAAGLEYAPYARRRLMRLGGNFSLKFPNCRAEILKKKLQNVAALGASRSLPTARRSCNCAAARTT
jgi:Fe-S oxidoreductase